jgi:NADPH-dependent 2,4-dienoyl-CoA reductase/sulfur reductase-like enzyme/rhodanese-related sulfurtransferase
LTYEREGNVKKKVLIIGGVAAGCKAASRIKRLDAEAEVTILEKGGIVSYGGCGLPYFISDVIKDEKELISTPIGVVRDAGYFKNVKGVTVHINTCAEEIDRQNKVVTAVDAATGERKKFPYDKLVIAVGGDPVIPPIEGVQLKGIYTLRTIEDGVKIKTRVFEKSVKKAVVVGSGLIGMEMAEAFHLRGIEVTVVEMLDWIFPALLDRDMGLLATRYVSQKGIQVCTGEKVLRCVGDRDGVIQRVITDKRELQADLVLLAVGVRPNVELAKKAGLAIGETRAIQVNGYLQTSDPDIYAGGDCVENTHRVTGKKIYAPLGSTANKHGRCIADHIAGRGAPFPGVLGTAICKVFDYTMARTGLSEREAKAAGFDIETVICPGPDRPHYYPGNADIIIKLIADKKSGRLLGSQIIGPGDAAKRTEIAVTALSSQATVQDIAAFDLAYAPPYSSAMDNMITAATVMLNKLAGIAKALSPLAVKEKMDRGEDFILLDVRSPKEYEALRIDHPAVTLIPLGKLREECRKLPKEKEIIAFCKVSLRGYEAQRILENQGFTRAAFMDGGVLAWPFETTGIQ